MQSTPGERRQIVVVAGTRRSGTILLAALTSGLGLRAPRQGHCT